jgi:hypothetical protein
MNTWASYADGSPSRIVLHSVPPLVVFVAAEAVTDLRDKLTEAVTVAFTDAVVHAGRTVHEPHPAGEPNWRIPFAEYLSAARQAWTPDVVITPAWVRQVTGCSRGLSSRLAAALRAETTGEAAAGSGAGS